MTQVIGFDAKETIRIGTNGSRYSYPLGVSVEVFDFNKFKEQYEQAIKTINKEYSIENRRKVYSFQYFAKLYGIDDGIGVKKPTNEFIKTLIQP